MRVTKFLDRSKVKYKVTKHEPAFTAQHMAAVEHEPGKYVAKPVVVKADGEYVMCVLPACYKIDLKALKGQLKAKKVELANWGLSRLWATCMICPPLWTRPWKRMTT